MQTWNNTHINVKTVSNDLESCGGTTEMNFSNKYPLVVWNITDIFIWFKDKGQFLLLRTV